MHKKLTSPWTTAPPEDQDTVEAFQRVSAKGLMSCSSLSGFSPQGEKRLPVPSERGRITVEEEDESGRRGRCPQHPAFTWV